MLDKPPTDVGSFQSEKYTTTGLPIFLDALLDAGALLTNLIGWGAGVHLLVLWKK